MTVIVIQPGRTTVQYWRDLWHYRELFQVLAWRDIAVRYKQTAIGVIWAVARPFLTMVVFTIVFSRIARLPSENNAPYAILVFAGMLPWTFFSTALSEGSNSLIANSNLVSKVYFPRIIVPAATVVVAFVDFMISFTLLIGVMLYFAYPPSWHIVFLPVFILLAFVASLGPSIWLTALNVRYRDFRYIVPFFVQFGLYVSPVGFSSSLVPPQWRLLYSLNPVVGVIDGFRWSILGAALDWPGFLVSLTVILFFVAFGFQQFRHMETSFADVI